MLRENAYTLLRTSDVPQDESIAAERSPKCHYAEAASTRPVSESLMKTNPDKTSQRKRVSTDSSPPTNDVPRSRTSMKVRAIIARRAVAAGLSELNYFREIIAGRAPRITRLEAAREPMP